MPADIRHSDHTSAPRNQFVFDVGERLEGLISRIISIFETATSGAQEGVDDLAKRAGKVRSGLQDAIDETKPSL